MARDGLVPSHLQERKKEEEEEEDEQFAPKNMFIIILSICIVLMLSHARVSDFIYFM